MAAPTAAPTRPALRTEDQEGSSSRSLVLVEPSGRGGSHTDRSRTPAMPLHLARPGMRGRRAETRPLTDTPGLIQEGSAGLPVNVESEPCVLQAGSEPGPNGACGACRHSDTPLPELPSARHAPSSQAAEPGHVRPAACMPVGGGGSAPGGPEQTSGLTLRERRVRANDTGRDGILMPGCFGAPRGPAANPITGIAARSRKRVQFTPSQSSLTEVSDGLEDTEPEAGTRDEGSRVSQAGAVSESGAGVGGADGVGVEGSLSGSTVSHTQPENPRRLMSFGSFSIHPVSQASDNSFSRSLLTSGSELIDMVSSYLPGFPSSRPSTPCNSSPTQRLPLSPRSLARTVSAEMCSSGGHADSCTPGSGQCDLAVPLPPRQMGDPAVLAPYSTIESGAIPILPTLKLPGGKLPPIMSPRLSENEAEQARARERPPPAAHTDLPRAHVSSGPVVLARQMQSADAQSHPYVGRSAAERFLFPPFLSSTPVSPPPPPRARATYAHPPPAHPCIRSLPRGPS